MKRAVAALAGLGLVLAACGDDGGEATPPSTAATVSLEEPLSLGSTYEEPTGNVRLTVRGVRLVGDLLLADAEACAGEDGLPGLPIEVPAWQLRVRGRDQAVPRVTLDEPTRAARPPWPDSVLLGPGECFEGKVPFRLPAGARPAEVVFTQLSAPVAWTIRD